MKDFSARPEGKREWQAVTGLDNQCFTRLLGLCRLAHGHLYGVSFEEKLAKNPGKIPAKFQRLEQLLFFTLMVLKSGITFDFAAFLIGFDQSRAHRQFIKGVHLLHYTLEVEQLLPLRHIETPEELAAIFEGYPVLILDATEQRIQRPQDRDYQREVYSGKKKHHTCKAMIISTLDRIVHFLSPAYTGKTHDYSLMKDCFDPALDWFVGFEVRVDLGYQGFATNYPGARLHIPYKKPPKKELTDQQRDKNRELARDRIRVEHTIGGIKRYDILTTPLRIHDFDLYDKVLSVCAGLWNFYITR